MLSQFPSVQPGESFIASKIDACAYGGKEAIKNDVMSCASLSYGALDGIVTKVVEDAGCEYEDSSSRVQLAQCGRRRKFLHVSASSTFVA